LCGLDVNKYVKYLIINGLTDWQDLCHQLSTKSEKLKGQNND